MSIKVSMQVWDTPCQNHTQKLVLAKLAENASDQGTCYPSLSTIARQCDLSVQAVITQIRKLEAAKLLQVDHGKGRKKNSYLLLPTVNGVEGSAQHQQSTALRSAVNGVEHSGHVAVNGVDPNRKTEMSMNRQKSVLVINVPIKLRTSAFMTTWKEWTEYRRELKGKPKNWAAMFNKQLEYLARFDVATAEEMLKRSMMNGWRGIFELKGNHENRQNTFNQRGSRPGADRNAGTANEKHLGEYKGVGRVL